MPPERVFVDTNVLISALLCEGNERKLLKRAIDGDVRLVVAEVVIQELWRVTTEKFPGYLPRLEWLLSKVDHELAANVPSRLLSTAAGLVRDPDDVPVLASILASKPDVALTGDKDLLTDEIKAVAPMCTCAEYLDRLAERSGRE